jgi:hypothetical protein
MALPIAIETSAKRLFPNLQPEQAIVELLLERAQKNLIKYQTAAREFENKYAQNFESFRKKILSSKPDSATEQDYFDWELAVTGVADMKDEIKRLKELQDLSVIEERRNEPGRPLREYLKEKAKS